MNTSVLNAPTVRLPREVVNMRDHMAFYAVPMNEAIAEFALLGISQQRKQAAELYQLVAKSRPLFGLVANRTKIGSVYDPAKGDADNAKINKNKVKTISFTFQAAKGCKVEIPADHDELGKSQRWLLVLNTCIWSGLCEAMCVLQHGRGKFSSVRAGRNWRTFELWLHPEAVAVLMFWEKLQAGRGVDVLLGRDNVDSDLPWHWVSNLFDIEPLCAYDYTKDPTVLVGDGWELPNYRRVYSWNEKSDQASMAAFLRRGGNVAVVTNRAAGGACVPFAVVDGQAFDVIDGDLSDNRFDDPCGVLVDLYAKGSAAKRPSAFVQMWY